MAKGAVSGFAMNANTSLYIRGTVFQFVSLRVSWWIPEICEEAERYTRK